MKLDFLCLGAQKAGTTTLHNILLQHTQIYLPPKKEAHFFDFDDRYKNGLRWLFDTFFTDYHNQKLIGKFTPEYIYFEEAARRIYDTLGSKTKFIVIFRDPVDRAVSHYNMTYRRGLEKLSFWEAIKIESERVKIDQWNKLHFSYISRGFYAKQLRRYLELFPIENFCFLTFENDIKHNLKESITRILDFLEVENEDLNYDIKSNEAFTPRFIKLNQLIRENKYLKKISHIIMPSKEIRELARHNIDRWNRISSKRPSFILTEAEKQTLYKEYFDKEISELQSLTGLDLKQIWGYK
jgi:hypothetical protein